MTDKHKRSEQRPKRFRRALIGLVVLVIALIAFAPTIALHTGLRNALLAGAVPAQAGSLTASGGGGGWFSWVRLDVVTLRDADDKIVFQAQEVLIDNNLLELLAGSKPVKVQVNSPVVNLVVRPDGDNLRDLLAEIQRLKQQDPEQPDESGALGGRDITALSIRDATVYVTDAQTGQRWTHQQMWLDVDLSDGLSTLKSGGRLGSAFAEFEPIATGNLPKNFMLTPQPREGFDRSVQLELKGAPINALDPFLRRLDPGARLAGTASGLGTAAWNIPNPPGGDWVDQLLASGLQTSGAIAVDQFAAQARVLGGDTLRLTRFETPWEGGVKNGRLVIRDAQVACDIGDARVRGEAAAEELRAMLAGHTVMPSGGWPRGRLHANVDIARLAQLAPAAVSLRKDVRPVSGRVVIDGQTEQSAGARLAGSVTASGFVAMAGGKQVAWDAPFSLSGALARSPSGLQVERLNCQSEFLNAQLQGDLANLNGDLNFDLDKLAAQLSQWLDLGSWRLAGVGSAKLRTVELAPGIRRATVESNLSNVMVAHEGRLLLQEPRLTANASAEAAIGGRGELVSLDAASVEITAGADRMTAQLTAPVMANPLVPQMNIKVQGDLTSWQNRLRVALAPLGGGAVLDNHRLSGQIDFSAVARIGQGVTQLTGANLNIKQLTVDSDLLAIREPTFDLSGDFSLDTGRGLIASNKGQLVTSSLTFSTEGVRASLAEGDASGAMAVGVILERLNNWFVATDRPLPRGKVVGMVELSKQNGQLHAKIDLTGEKIAFLEAGTKRPLLEEPAMRLIADTVYSTGDGALAIQSATIASRSVKLQASGTSQAGATQLTGTVDYNLDMLAPVIAGYLGPEITVTGKHQGRFSLAKAAPNPAAPLPWSRAWTGRLEAPWSSISLFGLPIGPGKLGLSLKDGEVRTDPIQLAVSQGALTTQLSARMDPPPKAWAAAPGPLLTDVQITPQISDRLLKYIAPVLADATRSQGVFSLKLASASGPIEPLNQLTAQGALDARSVLITPGPTTEQWAQLAKRIVVLATGGNPAGLLGGATGAPVLVSINQRTIDFRIENGRVYHDRQQYEIGDLTVYSTGSVGFDQTLDYVITIPIKDEWIRQRWMEGLRGKSMSVPIRGTFASPKPDLRELQKLSEPVVRDGLRGLLGGALEKLLEE